MNQVVIEEVNQTVSIAEDSTTLAITEQLVSIIDVALQGPMGPGIAVGGLTGQVLVKASAVANDTSWSTQSFEQDFTSLSVVTVNHNLGRKPSVTVIDTANDECIGETDHLSNNTCVVTFSAPFSGKVICN